MGNLGEEILGLVDARTHMRELLSNGSTMVEAAEKLAAVLGMAQRMAEVCRDLIAEASGSAGTGDIPPKIGAAYDASAKTASNYSAANDHVRIALELIRDGITTGAAVDTNLTEYITAIS